MIRSYSAAVATIGACPRSWSQDDPRSSITLERRLRGEPGVGHDAAPVIALESELSRNSTTEAISSGSITVPRGWMRPQLSMVCSGSPSASSAACRSMGVRTEPGSTQFTRIPFLAWSSASDFVSDTTPPLEAAYEATSRWLASACTEAMLTMAPPPRLLISGMECCTSGTGP